MIVLNKGQQAAVDALADFLASEGGTFYLAGCAGTGKTTTMGEATRLGVIPPCTASLPVAWCAPSWKAASVLRRRGRTSLDPALMAASSFHAVVYGAPKTEPQCVECGAWQGEEDDDCAHRWEKALRFDLDSGGEKDQATGVLIVDESSMLTRRMLADAQARGWRWVILLGDTYQLPPPTPSSPELRSALDGRVPDVELTEVMRTALDSPILRLATDVRENGWVRLPVGHPLLTKSGGRADVILVGTHNTRVRMTEMVRRQKGLSAMALPRAGEPLMACANYRSLELFNKTEARLVADGEAVPGNPEAWRGVISYFPGDRERRESVMLHRNGLFQAQAQKSPEWSGSAEADRRLRVWFGYACTVHSFQGSEARSVGVINESHMFREFASRHLYTAVSRARESLWVMQP